MKYNTLLCFDYGEKRIGIAVGQTITRTANPVKIIQCYRNRPDWAAIETIVSEWKPDALIVGIALNDDYSKQDITLLAEKFMRQLQGRFKLPVFSVDERLSTFEARKRTGSEDKLDAVAAQAILETWMNELNEYTPPGESLADEA